MPAPAIPTPPGRPSRDPAGVLRLCGSPIDDILATANVTTPAFVYDLDAIAESARSMVEAVGDGGLVAYAVKANRAVPVLRRLVQVGSGFDVVSGGELRLALACGALPDHVVYSGVAKSDDELDFAIATRIRGIHVESVEEIERIAARARARASGGAGPVPVAIRINPGVEADTHSHVATGHDEAKFGVLLADLPAAFDAILRSPSIDLVGLSVHVGSQLATPEPYVAGVRTLAQTATAARSRGFNLRYLDTGGGFGVPASGSEATWVPPACFIAAARQELREQGHGSVAVIVEPGRSIVAAAGVLVARAIQAKRSRSNGRERRWLLVDAGMNDLIRPALYQANHPIVPLRLEGDAVAWRVAGPVCESSDDFGEHLLPDPPPSHVVILEAGAYGRSMSSTYNMRPIASEVFVSAGAPVAVRRARSVEGLVSAEVGDLDERSELLANETPRARPLSREGEGGG